MWINGAQTGFKCHRCGEHGRIGDRGTWLPTEEFKAKMQRRRDEEWQDDLAKMKRARTMFSKTGQIYQSPGAEYLRSRGIDPIKAGKCGVRWAPNWSGAAAIVFAGRDAKGYLTAAQGRYIDPLHQPRMNTAGKAKRGVFSTCPIKHLPRKFAIVEAPLDALSYYQLSSIHAVATMGCWQQKWFVALCSDRRVILATDNDKAGELAAYEWAKLFLEAGVKAGRVRPNFGKDWNDVLRHKKGLL
jgi:hypothetical protein